MLKGKKKNEKKGREKSHQYGRFQIHILFERTVEANAHAVLPPRVSKLRNADLDILVRCSNLLDLTEEELLRLLASVGAVVAYKREGGQLAGRGWRQRGKARTGAESGEATKERLELVELDMVEERGKVLLLVRELGREALCKANEAISQRPRKGKQGRENALLSLTATVRLSSSLVTSMNLFPARVNKLFIPSVISIASSSSPSLTRRFSGKPAIHSSSFFRWQ
jgi:hypothetical protein